MIDPDAIAAHPLVRWLAARRLAPALALPLLLVIALGFIGWGGVAQSLTAKLPQAVAVPPVAGWAPVPADAGMAWVPLHGGSDRQLHLRLRNAAGATVDVSFALYANQGDGHEAGGFGQGAIPQRSRWAWERPGPPEGPAKSDVIQAPSEGPLPERRLCLTWYRSGALLTGSNLVLRLHAMGDHLAFHRQATAVLILSASDRFNADPAAALAAFLADIGPIDRWIDRLAAG
jgi:EpsI family protein